MKTAPILALLLFTAWVPALPQTMPSPGTAPAPPMRPADGPGAPHWTVMGAGKATSPQGMRIQAIGELNMAIAKLN